MVPSFAPPVKYTIGTQPLGYVPNADAQGVVTGVFRNGSGGKLDLVVSHPAESAIFYLAGNGDGSFQPPVQINIGQAIEGCIFAGDFNGDGKLDLFLPGAPGTNDRPIILLGNGDGTFKSPIASSTFLALGSTTSRGWAVGDFNGDGKLDLVAGLPVGVGSTGGCYVILLGNGDGTFKPPVAGPTGILQAFNRWVTVGDFRGNGILDLAFADGIGSSTSTPPAVPGESELTIMLGNGDGTFRFGGHYSSPGTGPIANLVLNPEDVMVADLRHNGILDVIVSNYTENINVFLGNGDGTFQAAAGYATDVWTANKADLVGEYPRNVHVADVNGDGIPDLVVDNVGIVDGVAALTAQGYPNSPGSVAVLLGNGDGTFQPPIQYTPYTYPGSLVIGNFKGHGLPDIAVTGVNPDHGVAVMLNQTGGPNPLAISSAAAAIPNPATGRTERGISQSQRRTPSARH